jgi:hypothetical protein
VKLTKSVAIMLLALLHALIFGIVCASIGARFGFYNLASAESFVRSAIPSAFITSFVVTSPLAFVAGRIGGRPFLLYSSLSFVLAWTASAILNYRLVIVLSKYFLIPPAVAFVAIACSGYLFFTLGARAGNRSARA